MVPLKIRLNPLILATATFVSGLSYAGHSWNTYHWARTANPFSLNVIDSMTPDCDSELDIAFARNDSEFG